MSIELESDDNLDVEKTKLPNIDQFFHGDPVTAYVRAAIEVLQGKDGAEVDLVAAAQNVYKSQKERGSVEEEEEYESLFDYVTDLDELHTVEVNEVLDEIEEELDGKPQLDKQDLELIKYYFKHLPGNSSLAIDALTDKGLMVAWRQKQLIRHLFNN